MNLYMVVILFTVQYNCYENVGIDMSLTCFMCVHIILVLIMQYTQGDKSDEDADKEEESNGH